MVCLAKVTVVTEDWAVDEDGANNYKKRLFLQVT